MNILFFPLRYLTLKDENKNLLLRRNPFAVIVIAVLLSVPFILTSANYFGDRGFLDRFGSFCGVLTGFYIAALVGIASFSGVGNGLDDEISLGKIYGRKSNGEPLELTRREYVSAIFGYLSFLAFGLSVLAILLITVATSSRLSLPERFGDAIIVIFNLMVSHMIVTTCHGMYYFIDRIYYQEPTLAPREDSGDKGKSEAGR